MLVWVGTVPGVTAEQRAAAAEMRATKLQAAVEEAGRAASERQGLEDELARRGQA